MTAKLPRPAQLPGEMPHSNDNLFRALCRGVVRLMGWQLAGSFPQVSRLVLIVAPHSSWWDGVIGLLVKVGIGAKVEFIGKQELFHGPLGWLLRRLGGVPVDRHAAHGAVGQVLTRFANGTPLWFALAPEGTRKQVQAWRSGFWHIAREAQVPILLIYFHYPEKTVGIGPLWQPSADLDADMRAIRDWYAPWQGKNRGSAS